MKLSNKILLITLIAIFGTITFTINSFKNLVLKEKESRRIDEQEMETLLDSEIETKKYPIGQFDKINLDLDGRVSVDYSKENWNVEVSMPKKLLNSEYTKIGNGERTLSIKSPSLGGKRTNSKVSVSITLPEIKEIKLRNRTRLQLNNFTQDNIYIDIKGNCMLQGNKNKFENMSLETFGENQISFARSEIKNADINGFGKNQIKLFMTGGTIKGNLGGAGVLAYSGDVELEDIDTMGEIKIINDQYQR